MERRIPLPPPASTPLGPFRLSTQPAVGEDRVADTGTQTDHGLVQSATFQETRAVSAKRMEKHQFDEMVRAFSKKPAGRTSG